MTTSPTASELQTVRANCDATLRQMRNEVKYLRDQLESESACKDKLTESLSKLNAQFLDAKAQAKRLLQEQDAWRRRELSEMQRRCQREIDGYKSESTRSEEEVRRPPARARVCV